MVLARKLAHLVRGTIWQGMGRGVSGVFARGRRLTPTIAFSLLGVVLALAGFVGALALGPTAAATHVPHHVTRPHARAEASQLGNRSLVLGAHAVSLPAATTAPVAAPTSLISSPPIASRENFAFAPYWTLPLSGTFSLTGLSTLAYFSLGVNPNGTIDESGPGWNGYQSQALADLITRAHAAGERVVLTVNDFGQSSLDQLTSSPAAATTLANALIPLLQSKSLDGVNFDFEGEGSHDQAGLTALIASVSGALRAADPHWQITMDTYASSAGDPGGFYDIPALAPYVDAFFVMAYELNLTGSTTPASPLTSGQFSDLTTLAQYTAAVPASKVILGTPFFGINWPTDNGTMAATATGPATDIADSQAQGGPQYWDPVTETGWTSYQTGRQWHESYFESPYGLYQVAQLAARYGVRGVGIWALGMEDDGAQMILALDGYPPPGGPGGSGPAATSASPATAPGAPTTTTTTKPPTPGTTTTTKPSTPGTTTTTSKPPVTGTTTTTTAPPSVTGVFNGATVDLTPVAAGNVDTLLGPAGTVTGITSANPAFACLDGTSLTVYPYGVLSGYDVAVAATPTNCVTQDFTFPS